MTYMFTINDGITHNVEHQKQLERVLVEDGYQCLVQLGAWTNQDRREVHYGSWFHTMQDTTFYYSGLHTYLRYPHLVL